MEYCIYGIIDPRTDVIFYIGETGDFAKRKRQHLKGTDQISGLIVKQIKQNEFVPIFTVLERLDDEETALRAEIYWIETMLSRGVELVNSQAFSGYAERHRKRTKETKTLNTMKTLRRVANGRKSKRTRPACAAVSKDGWTAAEKKRLEGMQENGIALGGMAKMLGRSPDEIRDMLAQEWQ